MNYLSDAMFWLSNGLLVPVIAALLYLFVRAILLLGMLFSSWQRHKSIRSTMSLIMRGADKKNVQQLHEELKKTPQKNSFFITATRLFDSTQETRVLLIGEFELLADKRLSSAEILAKFGPIVGLMGTLIPMGPALSGLAGGDIAGMSYNMQVAFATTVLGLFASAIGYIAIQITSRYNHQLLLWLDYFNERISSER